MAVKKTEAGRTFVSVAQRGGEVRPVEWTVAESCEGKDGRWMCITCDTVFQNNFMKDTHISEDESPKGMEHELVWMCSEHGPEVP